MKNILLILILCFINLHAYEYLIATRKADNNLSIIYYDENNVLKIKTHNADIVLGSTTGVYDQMSYLSGYRNSILYNYISRDTFENYYKNDIIFLNDLYTNNENTLQAFMNFLYNNNVFSALNYIHYNDYELLYNSDGLVVESIVNGVWKGLYDGPDNSGYLYNDEDELKYVNGVPVSFFQKINDKLMKRFKINLESIFMKKIFYPLLVLIFACVIFRAVIRMAVKAFLIRFYDNKIRRLEKRRENIENA